MFASPLLAEASLQTEMASAGAVLLQAAVVILLVLLNGFFVASEFAIVKVRESQLAALPGPESRRRRVARHVVAHLEAYLSATQLGITLASLALGWVSEPFLAHLLHPILLRIGVDAPALVTAVSLAVAFSLITFLHIVMGELAPKSLAIRQPLRTALWVCLPLELFHRLFRPAIWLLQGSANFLLRRGLGVQPAAEHEVAHTEEELRLLVAESARASVLSSVGARISARAFGLRHLRARDLATPRPEVVFLREEDSLAENLRRARASGHTRFPLCRGHLDEAIGLIHLKDLVAMEGTPPVPLAELRRELLKVPEMLSGDRLLETFLQGRSHLALVVDEFGGATGMVTLDNVLGELVGRIRDEFDPDRAEPAPASEDEFVVPGRLSLHLLAERTGTELESEDASTIGGYITSLCGRLPRPGETVRLPPFLVTVLQADGRRVGALRFVRQKEAPVPAG